MFSLTPAFISARWHAQLKAFLFLTLIFGFLVGTTQPSFAQQSASKPSALSQEDIAQAQKVLHQFLDAWLIQKDAAKMKNMFHTRAFAIPELANLDYWLMSIPSDSEARKSQSQFQDEVIKLLLELANETHRTVIKDMFNPQIIQQYNLKKGSQIPRSDGIVINDPFKDHFMVATGLEPLPYIRDFLDGYTQSPEETTQLIKSSVTTAGRLVVGPDGESGEAAIAIVLCKQGSVWKVLDVSIGTA